MKYELTIRELTEYTKEDIQEYRNIRGPIGFPSDRYSDKQFHDTRVLNVEVTQEQLDAIKKAIITVF